MAEGPSSIKLLPDPEQNENIEECSGGKKLTSEKDTLFFQDGKKKIDYVLVHEDDKIDEDNDDKNELLKRFEKCFGKKLANNTNPVEKRKNFEKYMMKEGLELEHESENPERRFQCWQTLMDCFKKVETTKKVYCTKIHVPRETLLKYAELLKMKMPIKENMENKNDEEIQQPGLPSCFEIVPELPNPFKLDDDRSEKTEPFTAAFSLSRKDQFIIDVGDDEVFTSAQRSRICFEILSCCHPEDEDESKNNDKSKKTNKKEEKDLHKNQDGEEDGAVVAYKDGARIEDQGENKNADQEKTENEDQYEAKTKDQERVKIETQDKDKKTKKNLNLIDEDKDEGNKPKTNGKVTGIKELIADQTYIAAYPLHDGPYYAEKNDRQILYELWAEPRMWYKYQSLDKIRNYFGEKVGIYFTWLGFYTSMLIPAAIAGVIVFIYGLATMLTDIPSTEICEDPIISKYTMCPMCDQECSYWHLSDSCTYSRVSYLFDNPATVAFAIIMALWASLLNEFWKRKQAQIKYHWDLADFEDMEENVRPQFKTSTNRVRRSPRTGEEEPYIPIWIKMFRYSTSFSVLFFFIALTLAAVTSVIIYRMLISVILHGYPERVISSASAAGINLVVILILDKVYQKIAFFLTDMELHRTQRKWEDAFTFKMFLFQFINFYSSIFYIAFFKGRFVGRPGNYDRSLFDKRQEECDPSGCLIDLCIQLGIVMAGKQIINNFKEIIIPKLMERIGCLLNPESKPKEVKSRWVLDNILVDLPELGLFHEYLVMVLQYGFVTIFVAAFPLAPLFALLNNLIEIRADAYKFTTQWKRPVAERVQDMGIWFGILRGISAIALFTNAAIIAFTSEFIPKLVYLYGYSPDQTLSGYTNFSLSEFKVQYFDRQSVPNDPKMEIFGNVTQCRYRGFFEEDPSSPGEYKYTMAFWHILAAKLAFVVIFENLVVFCTWLVMYVVPEIPYKVRIQMLQRQKVLFTHIQNAQKTQTKCSN